MNFKYIIFDMDGVLVNSEPVIKRAATEALALGGITADDSVFDPYIGAGEENFIIGPAKAHNIEDKIDFMMKKMYKLYGEYAKVSLEVFPSAPSLVTDLAAQGYTLALVSSSAKEKLLTSLEIGGIDHSCFSVVLSGNDVKEKKPSPEPYLTAAKKFSADPSLCLVVEDAKNGVVSAKGAGMSCVAVTTSYPENELRECGADFVVNDIGDIRTLLNR